MAGVSGAVGRKKSAAWIQTNSAAVNYSVIQLPSSSQAGVFVFGGNLKDKEGIIGIISTTLEKRLGKYVAPEPCKKLGMTYTARSIYSRTSTEFNVGKAFEDYQNGR